MLSMPSQEWHIRLLVAGFMLAMPLARIWWNRNIARPDTLGVLRRNRWDLVQLIVGGNLILLGVLCYVAWYEGTTVAHVRLPGWVRGGGLVVAVLAFWLIRWADVTLGKTLVLLSRFDLPNGLCGRDPTDGSDIRSILEPCYFSEDWAY